MHREDTRLENSTKISRIKFILKYFNPAALSEEEIDKISLTSVIGVSGLTYSLFFLQTGLDQKKAGTKTLVEAFILAIKGLGIGTIGLIGLSCLIFIIMKIFSCKVSLNVLIKSFALSYTTPLISIFLGLLLNIFLDINTALAFGVSGVLWSLNPLFRIIRNYTNDNLNLSLIISTVTGLLILFTWHALV